MIYKNTKGLVSDGTSCIEHSILVLILTVIHCCMNPMGLSQISYDSVFE
jgi:hypothetical protein